ERRLFYVAITRAKTNLFLSHANARYKFGQLQQNDPSRFIEEIPEAFLDKSYAGAATRNNDGGFGQGRAFERMQRGFGGGWGDAANAARQYGPPPTKKAAAPSYITAKPAAPKTVEHVPSADFVASDTRNLQAGQKVEHQKFGFGEVVKMEGAAHNPIATVLFELNGEKKIMLNYAKLRIISE
ncbi:MAG: ATP-dependent DNA helicase, partial [Chitinophagaceae bacterium]